jgi:hypothetical protein
MDVIGAEQGLRRQSGNRQLLLSNADPRHGHVSELAFGPVGADEQFEPMISGSPIRACL